MMTKKKKGFTIVELVIVIAVIGILAGILIPVFSNLINDAKIASDSTLVKNINTQLAIAEQQDGKNQTMYDALLDAKDAGYIVENINAKSKDNEIIWNQKIDRVALVDKDGNFIAGEKADAKDWELWVISSEVNEKYSTYYTGTATQIETTKGFDAGESEQITRITYDRSDATTAQTVTIRTNSYSTVLIVNAPNDIVNHYDKAKNVNVISVASSSYHENGDILGNVTLQNGRVVVESGAKANAVYVDATAEAIASGTVAVSADNSKEPEVPIILRDYVKIAADTKGGKNSIPDPEIHNVIVLGDKVTGDETKTAVASIIKPNRTVINYETFEDAFNAMVDGDTLLLTANATLTSGLEYDKGGDVTIDLNSYTLNVELNIEDVLYISNANSFSIINGSITTSGSIGDFVYSDSNVKEFILSNMDVVFESTRAKPAGFICCDDGTDFALIQNCSFEGRNGIQACAGDGEMLIENCKFNYNSSITNDNFAYNNISVSEGSRATINNCECLNAKYSVYVYESGGTAIINSGKYSSIDNGYCLRIDNNKNSVDWQGAPNYASGSFILTYGGTFNGKIMVAKDKIAQLYVYGGTFDQNISQYRR